ncbi:hydantoinase B/oxoprolinase family protein [Candidatus Poriferisodalis sp.]|uniref:hydantoinase B/oxoprolinase family protein n=1 Tax=Candidatus Poriferisodalis sp. TaxID=3101277 RepID=UPI003AF92716
MASTATEVDAVELAVMSSRFEGIVRQMENTLLRAARSTTLAISRDFSCSLATADGDLIAVGEGLPVHVYGASLLNQAMLEAHPVVQEGDAFLHNDPYTGGTHAADYSLIVPVFIDGEHMFTAIAKGHQADIGNSIPTTYMPHARDVYEEGALLFPSVKIQESYEDVADIIRMCQRRIRVPEIWYGDYLAQVAACRVAERSLNEFCSRYGREKVVAFLEAWFDYSEIRCQEAIRELPAGHIEARSHLDPFPGLPDGLPLMADIDVDNTTGTVTIDLRGNADCLPVGLNLSEATAVNGVIAGTLYVVNSQRESRTPRVEFNAGSFRCFDVKIRENCCVGIPRFPRSCSMATTTISERLFPLVFYAFAELVEGWGAAEPCYGHPPCFGVVSGYDPRKGGDYIAQLFNGTAGGPATAESDGWLSLVAINCNGLLYRDSIEVDEAKYPLIITQSQIRPDSEGAGRTRGAPGNLCEYGPLLDEMRVHYQMEGIVHPARGVRGGDGPTVCSAAVVGPAGGVTERPEAVAAVDLQPGERILSRSAGGGGYGSPLERDPDLVLTDVRERYVTLGRARDAYGVVITGDPDRFETLEVDRAATSELRAGRLG